MEYLPIVWNKYLYGKKKICRKKIVGLILTSESDSRIKIEFGAARPTFLKLILIVKKNTNVTNFSRCFTVNVEEEKRTGSRGTRTRGETRDLDNSPGLTAAKRRGWNARHLQLI